MSLSAAVSVLVKVATKSVHHADHVTVRATAHWVWACAKIAKELKLPGLRFNVDIALMGR